jgi:alpha-beta hydrolase superfamily lysophospholipase
MADRWPWELPLSFTVRGQRVSGCLHLPAGPGPHPLCLSLHGFTGNKSEQEDLARKLSFAGVAVFRFDYRGGGESEGTFDGVGFQDHLEDLRAARTLCAARLDLDLRRLALLGHSMGGCIASLMGGECGAKALVLWAPKLNLRDWARLAEAGFEGLSADRIRVWGREMDRRFAVQLSQTKPLEAASDFPGSVLVCCGGLDQVTPIVHCRTLEIRRRQSGFPTEACWMPEAGHLFSEPGQRRRLLEVTMEFLVRQLSMVV